MKTKEIFLIRKKKIYRICVVIGVDKLQNILKYKLKPI
jgi:hypothetical protein